jgi:predicted nucleotidyltransferase component of viral defense system
MDLEKINEIKKLAIIAMFSDDDLMERLVLKGGNALDIVYGIESRASMDLDFSMPSDFKPEELTGLRLRLENLLKKVFNENGYEVFDIRFGEKPEVINPNKPPPPFWGGYELQFKVVERRKFAEHKNDLQRLRLSAMDIGPGSKKTLRVEISKWEDCRFKHTHELENYTIYLYSPEMIVCEKLRAICQQMPEYQTYIGVSQATARARDFFDIYTTIEYFGIDLLSAQNIQLLKDIFDAKSVPTRLISQVVKYREDHRPDFIQVESTVKPKVKLRDFDFYFDYVVSICGQLAKPLGVV